MPNFSLGRVSFCLSVNALSRKSLPKESIVVNRIRLEETVRFPAYAVSSKFTKYWSVTIGSCNGDYNAIWSRLQSLLKSDTKSSSRLTVDDFARYFTNKIDRIRSSTAAASPPVIIDHCHRTAVCFSSDDGRRGRVYPEEISGKAMPAWPCMYWHGWWSAPAKPSRLSFPVRTTRHLNSRNCPCVARRPLFGHYSRNSHLTRRTRARTVQFLVWVSSRKSSRRSLTPGSVSTSPNTVFCLSINLHMDLTTRPRQQSSASRTI